MNSGPLAQGFGPVWFGGTRFGDSGVQPVARCSGGGREVLVTGGNRATADFGGMGTFIGRQHVIRGLIIVAIALAPKK